ncbi:MAG TPA: hypothetical protein VFB55_08395 [Verrucomicrobiae bacterium]|nr:hypothetical protein [Verrucomicrobiae bacterium]
MNDPELSSPLPSGDLTARVESLQRLVCMLLLVLIVVSATLAAYLAYQDHIYHKDAAAIRVQATAIINTYSQARASINQQAVTNFLAQLVTYARKNPDFAEQVMKKYGWTPPPSRPAAAPPVRK